MTGRRMVPVVRVGHGFEARVVAAKLGSEGIVTQFRGAVEGPYPVGAVDVLVAEDDVAEARAILAVDDAAGEAGGQAPGWAPADGQPVSGSRPTVVVVALALALLALALATAVGSGLGR